ncbi:MAG: DegT/DnrJ/EryC1/StrS family aminotransferase [Smithellaceae bacterium]
MSNLIKSDSDHIRTEPFPTWPFFADDERAMVTHVLQSGKVNYWTGEEGRLFEKEFAAALGVEYAVAMMNGTVALEAEQIVLKARRADGAPLGTVLRFGAIYGSRIKGNYERLTRALSRNRFIPVGDGFNRRTLIYDKDVGRAVVQAVSHPAAAGRLYNVTDGGFHTVREIIDCICSALGRTPPRLSLPIYPIRTLIKVIETGMHAFGLKSPVTPEMIDKYIEDIAVDGNLFQKEIGFIPHSDLKTGWEETIREMRNEKII